MTKLANNDESVARGPSPTWQPGSHHRTKIKVWGEFLKQVGVPDHKAEAWAFEIWKLGQKIETRT